MNAMKYFIHNIIWNHMCGVGIFLWSIWNFLWGIGALDGVNMKFIKFTSCIYIKFLLTNRWQVVAIWYFCLTLENFHPNFGWWVVCQCLSYRHSSFYRIRITVPDETYKMSMFTFSVGYLSLDTTLVDAIPL